MSFASVITTTVGAFKSGNTSNSIFRVVYIPPIINNTATISIRRRLFNENFIILFNITFYINDDAHLECRRHRRQQLVTPLTTTSSPFDRPCLISTRSPLLSPSRTSTFYTHPALFLHRQSTNPALLLLTRSELIPDLLVLSKANIHLHKNLIINPVIKLKITGI